ncbi:MAG TPA: hypothetical protein VFN92_03955 [Solirubrobacterales bacterium]|nr:hypothetical protein [Solirubrobacterales bacterium]
MNHLKMLGFASLAAMILMAVAGAGSASATTLQSGGKNLPAGTEIVTTLKPGTSSVFKDTSGTTVETCTASENRAKTTNESGTTVNGTVISQITGNCSHTADVIKPGELRIEYTSANSGKLYGINNEFTYQSTVFGISCTVKLSTSTPMGTFTGSTSGNATMDINGVVNAGICGDATWTATYTVTSPSPLTVVK